MTSFADVAAFIAQQTKEPLSNLAPETRLLHDLRLDGDDAHNFLSEFATRFDVDLTTFSFLEYF